MAVRGSRRCKRFTYVSPIREDTTSNSDSDHSGSELSYNATSEASLSVRNSIRSNRSYEESTEHGYSQRRAQKRKSSDTFAPQKRKRCENKNAINARINRERKKAYVAQLEGEIEELRNAGKENAAKVVSQEVTIQNLTKEVSQLKSLLANNKYLGALVSKLSSATGLPVTSSLFANEEAKNSAHQPRIRSVPYGSANHPIAISDVNFNEGVTFTPDNFDDLTPSLPKLESEDSLDFNPYEYLPFDCTEPLSEFDSSVGICVHINQNRLSVEFCSVCNSTAP